MGTLVPTCPLSGCIDCFLPNAVNTSHKIFQVRNTAMCEPATKVHPHEHLQTNAHSKLNRSFQNISNTSDLWGMGIQGQPVSQLPSAIYQPQ